MTEAQLVRKIAKMQRRITLLRATTAAAEGNHAEARALFAECGVSYCSSREGCS